LTRRVPAAFTQFLALIVLKVSQGYKDSNQEPMKARFEKVLPAPGRSLHVVERQVARFDAPWHFHPEIELTLIVQSQGRRFVGDNVERFGAGDLVLLGPNLPHFWHNEGAAERAHSVVVQFHPGMLGPKFWLAPEMQKIRRLLRRSERGLAFTGRRAKQAEARLRVLGARAGLETLLEVLAILELLTRARARELASPAYAPSLNRQTEARLARVYALLTTRFREPLTLVQIAQVAAMTPAAFSRYFKRAAGRNVSDLLNDLRIDHAARLLAETQRSVSDIAHESGFATFSNFNRRFRERLKCAPRDYRNSLASVDSGKVPHNFVLPG
jgi:AraC-like DNA-binding protein